MRGVARAGKEPGFSYSLARRGMRGVPVLFPQPCFFFNCTAPTEIYTLSLHDALPIFDHRARERVELVGPVQRDRRDLVLDLVEQVAHDGLSFPTANRCHSPGTPLSAWTPRSSNRR